MEDHSQGIDWLRIGLSEHSALCRSHGNRLGRYIEVIKQP